MPTIQFDNYSLAHLKNEESYSYDSDTKRGKAKSPKLGSNKTGMFSPLSNNYSNNSTKNKTNINNQARNFRIELNNLV